jgi:hypothetical protein
MCLIDSSLDHVNFNLKKDYLNVNYDFKLNFNFNFDFITDSSLNLTTVIKIIFATIPKEEVIFFSFFYLLLESFISSTFSLFITFNYSNFPTQIHQHLLFPNHLLFLNHFLILHLLIISHCHSYPFLHLINQIIHQGHFLIRHYHFSELYFFFLLAFFLCRATFVLFVFCREN